MPRASRSRVRRNVLCVVAFLRPCTVATTPPATDAPLIGSTSMKLPVAGKSEKRSTTADRPSST